MNTATWTLVVLAAALLAYAWWRGDGSHRRGLVEGWRTLRDTLALLITAFLIVGYVNVLAPQDLVQSWIGPGSGLRGLLLAEGAGTLLPGGPYVVFPLIAALCHAGASLGPAVALITSWATLSLLTVTFELPFLGWRFTAVRFALGLAVPVLAGALAQALFGS
jgi:uncharacterized membrane protein YraQ (UPF0718 family)